VAVLTPDLLDFKIGFVNSETLFFFEGSTGTLAVRRVAVALPVLSVVVGLAVVVNLPFRLVL